MSSLHCAIIQTDIFWENKARNLAMLEEKILALEEPVELVILPEMFSTGFSMNTNLLAEEMAGDTVKWMKRVSQIKKTIITGSVMIKENDNFFNRLIWMLPNGQFGYYDKRHLFGYANEDQYYSKGNKRLITSVNGWKVNLQICYDLRFPVWSRQQCSEENNATHEFDLLIYVANWPSSRANAWKTLLCARAIENQCFVVGVNRIGKDGNDHAYAGDSMIIDPLGTILNADALENDTNKEKIYAVTLTKEGLTDTRNRFPFLKDADKFYIM